MIPEKCTQSSTQSSFGFAELRKLKSYSFKSLSPSTWPGHRFRFALDSENHGKAPNSLVESGHWTTAVWGHSRPTTGGDPHWIRFCEQAVIMAVYIHPLRSSRPDRWGHTIRDHWKALPFALQLRQNSLPVYYDMYVKVKILPQCVGDGRTYAQYAVMLQDSACFSLGLWAFHADRDEMSQLTSLSSWTFFVIVISKCQKL